MAKSQAQWWWNAAAVAAAIVILVIDQCRPPRPPQPVPSVQPTETPPWVTEPGQAPRRIDKE
jgi:hypothetical protein